MGTLTVQEAEQVLYTEGRLLDERKFDEWLRLYSKDGAYWIPMEGKDPNAESSILYTDRADMEDRISRLRSPRAHAQSPPSETVHLISNVQIAHASDDAATVFSSFVVHEVRTGRERAVAGRCEHQFKFEVNEWKIYLKKVWLVNRSLPIYNLSFII